MDKTIISSPVEAATTQQSNLNVWTCEGYSQPSSQEILDNILNDGPERMATMFIPFALLFLVILLFVDEVIYYNRHSVHWKQTAYSLWVLSVFPVLMSLCILGLYAPRTLGIVKFSITFYFAIAIKQFFNLMLLYYGGKRKLEAALQNHAVVSANPFPCCFICCCCRNAPMTIRRLNILKALTDQITYVYPISYFILTVLAAEITPPTANLALINFVFEFIVAFSSLSCLYACVVIAKASVVTLQHYRLRAKYICIQLLLAIVPLQDVIMDILDGTGVLSCGFPYPNIKKAVVFHFYILISELFVLAIFAWYIFKIPEKDCIVAQASKSHMSSNENISTPEETGKDYDKSSLSQSEVMGYSNLQFFNNAAPPDYVITGL